MNNTTHTPGLWHVGEGPYARNREVFDQNKMLVADCRTNNKSPETEMANARLIAAAPEMLEALKAVATLNEGQGRQNLCQVAGQARQAIAKAEAEGKNQ